MLLTSSLIQHMKLETNVVAPPFVLQDIFGRTIDLLEYKDKKVLIAFFRHAGCPFCNLRVHELTKAHEMLKKKGLEMIFFFESKERVLLRSTFHTEVSPIPLISDPEKEWYNAYGLETSGFKAAVGILSGYVQMSIKAKEKNLPVFKMADGESIRTMPAEFLLDKGLVVKKFHYSQRLTDRLPLEEIHAFAEQGSVQNKPSILS